MALLFDFFPVLLFFIAYKAAGIFVATAVLIVATIVQLGVGWLRNRKVQVMHLVTAGLVLLFGGLTLAVHDEVFIKWKPTIVYWLFASAFVAMRLFSRRSLLERLMAEHLALPGHLWPRLDAAWTVFFLALGALNLYVAYAFSTATWVDFKLFGLLGLTLLFVLIQGFYIARYLPDEGRS